MSLTEKKQSLLYIVEDADEKLTDLLIALANKYNDAEQTYSEEELAFFKERRNAFFQSDKKGYTVEEAHKKIRSNYKNGL